MRSFYSCLVFALLLSILFWACSKNEIDTTPPALDMLLPDEILIFPTGTALPFQASYTDNRDLQSFTLSIRGHFNPLLNSPNYLTNAWDTTLTRHIGGQVSEIDLLLDIPATVKSGEYELMTYCLDVFGNGSDSMRYNFRIANMSDTVSPTLNLIAPLPVDGKVVVFTPNIVYIIEVSDDKLLSEAIINLLMMDGETLIYQSPVVDLSSTVADFIAVTVPAPLENGLYLSQIVLSDAVNNQTIEEFVMEVH